MTEEVIGKSTIVIEDRLLFVSEFKEAPGGEVTEEDIMQEFVDENQTNWTLRTPLFLCNGV